MATQNLTADQPCLPHDEPRALTSLRVLGTAAVLLLLGALVVVMATQRTHSTAGEELLQAWFEVRALPEGLSVADGAVTARGDEVVQLALANAPEEAPRKPVAEVKPGEEQPKFDWSKLAIGPEDTPPVEVLIQRLPLRAAKGDLETLFRSGEELRGDFKSIPNEGGRRIIGRGELAWGGFNAGYAHEREFEAGGTFRDVMRVNLSRETTPCVLIARWPRGYPASKKRVEELLAALGPRA